MKTQTESLGAVKSCQLQSILHFYNIVFLNLRAKYTKAKNQLKVTKHSVVSNSSSGSLQLALKGKPGPFRREHDLKFLSPLFFSIFDEKLSHPWIQTQKKKKQLNFLRLVLAQRSSIENKLGLSYNFFLYNFRLFIYLFLI